MISCGFAAALVLGLIFSLVQPPEDTGGRPGEGYCYFEFGIVDPEAATDGFAYMTPDLSYKAETGDWVHVPLALTEAGWVASPKDFSVSVIGAAGSEPYSIKLLGADFGGPLVKSGFGILITKIPAGFKINAQLIYSGRNDIAKYAPGLIPKVDVFRHVYSSKRVSPDLPQKDIECKHRTTFAPID